MKSDPDNNAQQDPVLSEHGVGAIVGLIGWFYPMAMGGDHALAETVPAHNLALAVIPIMFVIRFFLTTSSYGTGAAGAFSPLTRT